MMRPLLAASLLACALLVPGTSGAAGAVLPLASSPTPAFVDVRMAVAVSPAGSARWTEVTAPSGTPVMWLVPVRPGAAVDWAPRRWLDALDDATAPRILPPIVSSTCPLPRNAPEKGEPWTAPRPSLSGVPVSVQPTADALRAHVRERGHRVSPSLDTKIGELYERGWNLVAAELPAGATAQASATLRVSDDGNGDGPEVLPLALTGGGASTRITVFAIGTGVASVLGTRDIDGAELRWTRGGSTFSEWRSSLIRDANGKAWLRESSSHAAIFDGTPIPAARPIASVVAGYLPEPLCSPAAAQALSADQAAVAVSCAPGAAARVPGDARCVPSSSGIDPAVLRCSTDVDLALALSGLAPAKTVVTRLVGWIPAGAYGTDLGLRFDPTAAHEPPVIHAAEDDVCTNEGPSPVPVPRPEPTGPSRSSSSSTSSSGGGDEPPSDGCGGGPVVTGSTTYEEPAPEPEDARVRAAVATARPRAGTTPTTAPAGTTATRATRARATSRLRPTPARAAHRAPRAAEVTMAGTAKTATTDGTPRTR